MKNNRFFSRSTHAETDRQNSNGSISPNMLGLKVFALSGQATTNDRKGKVISLITLNGIAGRG